MAPALLYRRLENGPSSPQLKPRDGSEVVRNPWLIIVIVIGILVIATLIVLLVVHQIRRRRFAKKEDQQHIEPLGRRGLGVGLGRRKMSVADIRAVEERERATMIRKSLASRTSTTFSTRSSRLSEMSQYELAGVDEQEREQEQEPVAPRLDWKEYEAGVPSERAHPAIRGVAIQEHPALSSPRLSVPQPSRAPSPVRGVVPPVRNPPPPHLSIRTS
ncbi:hypothetical protein F5B20DRAFT_559449 [Whalleya microplaca]|nr:hypothetical protein F5B20DRAFT_559449 [Whalleya microplaca]